MHGSADQPYFSPKRSQIRKYPSMGFLQAPPLLPYSVLHQQPPQPPLLPLPAAHPHRSSSSRGGLSSPAARNSNRIIKDHPPPPQTSKKSKYSTKNIPRKEEMKKSLIRSSSGAVTTVSSTIPFGSDANKEMMPNNNVAKVVSKGVYTYDNDDTVTKSSSGSQKPVKDQVDITIPGFSVFTISSPPPSNLPLPTFCLRRKSVRP